MGVTSAQEGVKRSNARVSLVNNIYFARLGVATYLLYKYRFDRKRLDMRYIRNVLTKEMSGLTEGKELKDARLECIQRLTDFPRGVCPQKIGLAKKSI